MEQLSENETTQNEHYGSDLRREVRNGLKELALNATQAYNAFLERKSESGEKQDQILESHNKSLDYLTDEQRISEGLNKASWSVTYSVNIQTTFSLYFDRREMPSFLGETLRGSRKVTEKF